MMDQMESKIPFYMTYPMQNLYLMEMEYEKDMDRMKQLYPKEVQLFLPVIEKHCDELEFEGSRIYDEDPDVYMMNQEMERVYEKCRAAFPEYFKEREANAQRNITRNDFSLVPPEGFILPKSSDVSIQSRRGCDNDWLCGTLGIMFQNEVYRRRCRHRRCHRGW